MHRKMQRTGLSFLRHTTARSSALHHSRALPSSSRGSAATFSQRHNTNQAVAPWHGSASVITLINTHSMQRVRLLCVCVCPDLITAGCAANSHRSARLACYLAAGTHGPACSWRKRHSNQCKKYLSKQTDWTMPLPAFSRRHFLAGTDMLWFIVRVPRLGPLSSRSMV